MFLSTGCSFLRAEGFSCSLGGLFGGLGISKLQFLIKKIKISSCKLIRIRIWIRIKSMRIRNPGKRSISFLRHVAPRKDWFFTEKDQQIKEVPAAHTLRTRLNVYYVKHLDRWAFWRAPQSFSAAAEPALKSCLSPERPCDCWHPPWTMVNNNIGSVADPGCLSRIPDLGSKNSNKREGCNKFVVIPFLLPQNSQNCKLFYVSNAEEKNLGHF